VSRRETRQHLRVKRAWHGAGVVPTGPKAAKTDWSGRVCSPSSAPQPPALLVEPEPRHQQQVKGAVHVQDWGLGSKDFFGGGGRACMAGSEVGRLPAQSRWLRGSGAQGRGAQASMLACMHSGPTHTTSSGLVSDCSRSAMSTPHLNPNAYLHKHPCCAVRACGAGTACCSAPLSRGLPSAYVADGSSMPNGGAGAMSARDSAGEAASSRVPPQ
jgi:hypothetical protein